MASLKVLKSIISACEGGSLFLFNRKTVRFFRKDGHDWRKKSDGKTVRETHEKLKVCLSQKMFELCFKILSFKGFPLAVLGEHFP